MLIINADDWGRSAVATDNTAACYTEGRITSTSAMVFMADSERGAGMARELGIDVGLHINFSEKLTGRDVAPDVAQAHEAISRFLRVNRYALLFYHPFLRRQFELAFRAQVEEFVRLYNQAPSHLDGHQHLHLASNVLLDKLMPAGTKVRRSFSFGPGEKGFVNRAYRSLVDRALSRRHRLTDYFFALSQNLSAARLGRVITLAQDSTVELMTHPEVAREFDFLRSDDFARAAEGVPLGSYSQL